MHTGSGIDKKNVHDMVLVGGSIDGAIYDPKVLQWQGASRSMNPDEEMAYGAAVQCAIRTGEGSSQVQDLLLLDVTPLSISSEKATLPSGLQTLMVGMDVTLPSGL